MMVIKSGKHINVDKNATFSWKIEIGDNSGIGARSNIYGKTIIGSNVMMGPDVNIYTQNHNFTNVNIPMNKQGMQEEKIVTIEDDVWIGGQVIILPGITIGKGSIIGAGTVVSKNVPPFSIYCGNPGTVKKKRV